MSNPSKAKGTKFETDVTRYLQDAGLCAVKPRQAGHADLGDIHVPPFTIQAKAYTDILAGLRAAVDGYPVQRANAGLPFGAGVVKRPRKPTGEAYVVLRLADFPALVRAVQRGEQG